MASEPGACPQAKKKLNWCGDETAFPREVADAALAHKVGNAVEQAYRHSSALDGDGS